MMHEDDLAVSGMDFDAPERHVSRFAADETWDKCRSLASIAELASVWRHNVADL